MTREARIQLFFVYQIVVYLLIFVVLFQNTALFVCKKLVPTGLVLTIPSLEHMLVLRIPLSGTHATKQWKQAYRLVGIILSQGGTLPEE